MAAMAMASSQSAGTAVGGWTSPFAYLHCDVLPNERLYTAASIDSPGYTSSTTSPKWSPLGKENLQSASTLRRKSRSFTNCNITSRRHVSPDDSTQSLRVSPADSVHSTHSTEHSQEPSPSHSPPPRSLAQLSTASRVYLGFHGALQRTWHAVESWWSKFRAVFTGSMTVSAGWITAASTAGILLGLMFGITGFFAALVTGAALLPFSDLSSPRHTHRRGSSTSFF